MKKTLVFIRLFSLICFFAVCMSIFANADTAYQTYTYSYDGNELLSPDAYRFYRNITCDDIGIGKLSAPESMCTDKDGNIYIADTQNNRIICLDSSYRLHFTITTFLNPDTSEQDSFSNPKGVFVTADGMLYVADTDNSRIVIFDTVTQSAVRLFSKPDDPMIKNYIYTPSKLVVDEVGRIYVVAENINAGIVTLDTEGAFTGFMGAKKVTSSLSSLFGRLFMTKAQKSASVKFVPTTYNNIAIDETGFLYVTTDTYTDLELYNYIHSRSKTDMYAPVRRLNAVGNDILLRHGFFPPAGDVNFKLGHTENNGASHIVAIALSTDGSYSLLDAKRGKVFTYDESGNLLHAFGGYGTQNGLTGIPSAIAYQGNNLLILDSENGRIVIYSKTTYGELISEALLLASGRKYSEAVEKWKEVLKQNNNFEIAYAAMGQNYISNEQYNEALECFKQYRDVSNYSIAFSEVRNTVLNKNGIYIVIIFVLLVIVLIKLAGKIKKINKEGQSKDVRQTVWRRILYGFHICLHPFNGIYDMKHGGRGNVQAASYMLGFTALSFIFKDTFSGYIFNGGVRQGLLMSSATLLLPFLLWCVSNWCLTTLMDGEGKLKHIYMVACYGLLPIAIVNIVYAFLSNVMTVEEGAILSLLVTIFNGWSFILIIFGGIVVHDYTFSKNLLMTLFTVIGMAIILFISLLFGNVIQKMIAFAVSVYNEIAFRF